MYYAMQEYCSAAVFAKDPQNGNSLSGSESLIFSSGSPSPVVEHNGENPIVVALLRWTHALREVAAGANPTDRDVLESLAEEKLLQAKSYSETDAFDPFDLEVGTLGFSMDRPTNSFEMDATMDDNMRPFRNNGSSRADSDLLEGWGWGT